MEQERWIQLNLKEHEAMMLYDVLRHAEILYEGQTAPGEFDGELQLIRDLRKTLIWADRRGGDHEDGNNDPENQS